MNACLYYGLTFLLFALEVWLAIVVNDISSVFGYIGTIAGTSLQFFIPSAMFCRAFSVFTSPQFQFQHKTTYWVSVANFLLGVFFFGFYLYADII